ncbi:MAG: hypothetical protein HY815_25465 [Candidatus Riflebacteria bacterium]|nr:hypothetical protein [Candidatus Riflebacteria bacterium]
MPLENLFAPVGTPGAPGPRRRRYERFGVLDNPFPAAAQTSGHPHLDTGVDAQVDEAIKAFVEGHASNALAVTATQGIGKTNLLNAYTDALRNALGGRGYYVIRYMPDPEPSFDPLLRSIFEQLGEEHFKRVAATAAEPARAATVRRALADIQGRDVRSVVEALCRARQDGQPQRLDEIAKLAYEWFIGLPARKLHREGLGVNFRLDSVESRTRALRDIAYFSAALGELQGIFLLLDELEKHGSTYSKGVVLRYLSALRALIDALPRYLFLMVALTTDALERYREMLPALKGRLANEVHLVPIRDEDDAVRYWRYYLDRAREDARLQAQAHGWPSQSAPTDVVPEPEARKCFRDLRKSSTVDGVRQRDFLDHLNRVAGNELGGSAS